MERSSKHINGNKRDFGRTSKMHVVLGTDDNGPYTSVMLLR